MVMNLFARAAGAARRDWRGFVSAVSGVEVNAVPPKGLHTYDIVGNGGRSRVHLRTHDDGGGMLFLDVTDAVYLSATAVHMAWLALEGFDEASALFVLQRTYGGVSRADLTRDYRKMAHTIESLRTPTEGCRTCLAELAQTPLFQTRARAPHKVDLALTYACNNDCPHCYNDPSHFDLESMPTDDWKRVLDQLAAIGVPHVIFTGGEATMHKGLVDIIAHAESLGIMCGLNSNGRAFGNGKLIEKLVRAGLDHVQITLESHDASVHDAMVASRAWEQTVAGVRACVAVEGLHTITNTTITRLNKDEIEDTVTFLHDLGLRTFAMNGMIYSGGGDANPDAIPQGVLPPILIRVRDRARELSMRFLWYTVTEYCEMSPVELEIGAKRCNAGEYSMCVEPNGDVLPCQSFYVSAGNMLRDPWETIWRGDLFRSFRDREISPVEAGLPEKCWECPDLPLCGGGCRIERDARDGKGPSGCQSCASGGATKSGKHNVRSTGIAASQSGCGSKAEPLIQLRLGSPR